MVQLLRAWLRIFNNISKNHINSRDVLRILLLITLRPEYDGGLDLSNYVVQMILNDVVSAKNVSKSHGIPSKYVDYYYLPQMSIPIPEEVLGFVSSCTSTSAQQTSANNNNHNNTHNNEDIDDDANNDDNNNINNINNLNDNNERKSSKDNDDDDDDDEHKGFKIQPMKNIIDPEEHQQLCGRIIFYHNCFHDPSWIKDISEEHRYYESVEDSNINLKYVVVDQYIFDYYIAKFDISPEFAKKFLIILKDPSAFKNDRNAWEREIDKQFQRLSQLNFVKYGTIFIPSPPYHVFFSKKSKSFTDNYVGYNDEIIEHDLGLYGDDNDNNNTMTKTHRIYIQSSLNKYLIEPAHRRHATVLRYPLPDKNKNLNSVLTSWDNGDICEEIIYGLSHQLDYIKPIIGASKVNFLILLLLLMYLFIYLFYLA